MSNDIPPAVGELPTIAPSSLASRLSNLFVSPGEVFVEVKTSRVSHANWLVPALLFILASWCAAALMFSNPSIKQQMVEVQDEAMQKQFQKQIDSGKMTQAQVDQMKAGAAKVSGIVHIASVTIAPVFAAAATPFWGGFVLWVGAMFIFKRPFEFLKGVEVVGLAMTVVAVGALVKGLLCAAMGNMFAVPGPILLIKHYDPTNQLHNALLMLDVFAVWALILRGIGLAKLSDISPAKALAWVLGVWITITGGMFALSWAIQKIVGMAGGQR